MARLLHDKGYASVRPMLGGLDAWLEAGLPVEAVVLEDADSPIGSLAH
jgi:rhodanese-related sulfurtransferase